LEFPEPEEQQCDHAHDHVGGSRQPNLRQSIVVAKPVRHAEPARERSFLPGLSGARSRNLSICSEEARTVLSTRPPRPPMIRPSSPIAARLPIPPSFGSLIKSSTCPPGAQPVPKGRLRVIQRPARSHFCLPLQSSRRCST